VTIAFGGSVWLAEDSAPAFRACTIAGCRAQYGGAMFCRAGSRPLLCDCTITGNSGSGAGLYCEDGSAPALVNCIIAANGGTCCAGAGGGILAASGSSPVLIHCTVAANYGAGLTILRDARATLRNTILWGNECGSTSMEEGGSLDATYSCVQGSAPGQGNIEGDPRFIRNGVYDFEKWPDVIVQPPDLRLRPGSPAIDAGTCEGAPDHDIAGRARPMGAGCDMGAYEFSDEAVTTPFVRGDANADGAVNIADPIFCLMYQFAAGPPPGCIKAADVNDNGQTDIADPIFALNYLFASGPEPPPPFAACGADPTSDGLPCDVYEPCR